MTLWTEARHIVEQIHAFFEGNQSNGFETHVEGWSSGVPYCLAECLGPEQPGCAGCRDLVAGWRQWWTARALAAHESTSTLELT